MFERFGEDALRVVTRARDEALGLSHDHVGTEHLLLGLMGGEATPASEALVAAGASLASVREKVVEALASRTTRHRLSSGDDLPFSDRAQRALDRAGRLSLRMGSDEVRAEHILLSLLTVEGTAGQVLRGLGADPATVEAALASSGRTTTETGESAQQELPDRHAVAGPLCASCGASLEHTLGRARVTISSGHSPEEVDLLYCTACGTAIGGRTRRSSSPSVPASHKRED